jgi:hydrogenase expression/formation protein HypE
MNDQQFTVCPLPHSATDHVTLAHGEGGRLMRELIRDRIVARLSPDTVQIDADAADIGRISGNIALTTDSYVVTPMFFPGGDIGSLAVFGTVNDLAMSGARPLYLTLSLIIEEGVSLKTIDRIMTSVARSADACDVKIVTGDTKVVPAGAVDGVFINTSGVGLLEEPRVGRASDMDVGDRIIVSGPIAQHGLSVLSARESLGFTPPPSTDSAPLHEIAAALRRTLGSSLHAMRDATRGGVAAVLHEWAEACGHAMWIEESAVPLSPSSEGICETLGLDPLFIANEGTFLAAVAAHRVDEALSVLRQFHSCTDCANIGSVQLRQVSPVVVRRGIGIDQPLDEPIVAMLPRIC